MRFAVIPVSFAFAAVAARISMRALSLHGTADLAQPLVVVTKWHQWGLLLFIELGAAICIAAIGYFAVLRAPRLNRLSPWQALMYGLGASLAALAAAWIFPVLFSSDVYAYAAYGEAARIGLDPYSHIAHANHDVIFTEALWQWSGTFPVCVYGPLFVEISRWLVTLLAPLGVVAQLDGFRALASLALPASGALLYAALAGLPAQTRLRGAFALALNPAAIWVCAEGHNDVLVVAALLAVVIALRHGATATASAAAVACTLLKVPSAAVAAAFAIDTTLARRSALRAWLGLLIGGVIVTAFSRDWLRAALSTVAQGHYAPQASLQALFPLAIVVVIAVLVGASGVPLLLRGDRAGWCQLTLGAWLVIPNPYPWYALWILPIAQLAPKTKTATVLVGLSLTSMVRYLPDAVAVPNGFGTAGIAAVAVSPLLLFLTSSFRKRS